MKKEYAMLLLYLLKKNKKVMNEHLTLLSNLAVALMEDEFKDNIKKSNNEEMISK